MGYREGSEAITLTQSPPHLCLGALSPFSLTLYLLASAGPANELSQPAGACLSDVLTQSHASRFLCPCLKTPS